MTLFIISFLAGIVTVLTPCSFLLLPVILGSSATSTEKWKPYVVTISLGLSLLIFTILLKATSILINISPSFLQYFSGSLLVILGLVSLFPNIWDTLSIKLGLANTADSFLHKARGKSGFVGSVLTGFALGPVFSSCSPTYVYILTTVLRENIYIGLIHMFAYLTGLTLIMLLVSILGQKFTKKLRFAINPNGWFKRLVAILFIIIGIAILAGLDKVIQSSFATFSPVNQIEQRLLNQNQTINLKDQNVFKPAPEIVGVSDWINSDGETIAEHKGKVVLIDFWTYSCVNCVRNSPYLNSWYEKYRDQGFVIIGMHAPEFAFEKNPENVKKAVKEDFNIKYPVGLDNDFATWDAYENKFWPSAYLIDKDGNIRYTHAGEGEYEVTEKKIQELLAETGVNIDTSLVSSKVENSGSFSAIQTPETYLGWSRGENFKNSSELVGKENKEVNFTLNSDLKSNQWSLGGSWIVYNQRIVAVKDSVLKLNFTAKEVYIVASPSEKSSQELKVLLNGNPIGSTDAGSDVDFNSVVKIENEKLYRLVKLQGLNDNQILELKIEAGTSLYAFTFGS